MKFALLLVASLSLSAAPVFDASTACYAFQGYNPPTLLREASGSGSCLINDLHDYYVEATTYSSYTQLQHGFEAIAGAQAFPVFGSIPNQDSELPPSTDNSARAIAMINSQWTGSTAGTERQGLMRAVLSASPAFFSFGNASLSKLKFGSYSVDCEPSDFGPRPCSAMDPSGTIQPYDWEPFEVPVTLGTSQSFSLLASAVGYSDQYRGLGISSAYATMQVTFFEADGVTPVEYIANPEPSTFLLSGLGILALIYRVRKLNTSTAVPQVRLPQ